MFHVRGEGLELYNGFNFYHWRDPVNLGFIFRYGPYIPDTKLGSKTFWFRYSKSTRKWIIKFNHINDIDQFFAKPMSHYINYKSKK
jgi:hypothetical protein